MSSTYSHQVNTDIYNVHSVHNIVLLAALNHFLHVHVHFSHTIYHMFCHLTNHQGNIYMLNLVLMNLTVRMKRSVTSITIQMMGTTTKKQSVHYQMYEKWRHNSVVNVKLTWFKCLNCSVCKKYKLGAHFSDEIYVLHVLKSIKILCLILNTFSTHFQNN